MKNGPSGPFFLSGAGDGNRTHRTHNSLFLGRTRPYVRASLVWLPFLYMKRRFFVHEFCTWRAAVGPPGWCGAVRRWAVLEADKTDFEEVFWAAARHPSFVRRFRGREHPLQPNNPVSCYLPDTLLAKIQALEAELGLPMHPRNRWVLTNSLAIRRSWLRQSMFIFNRLNMSPD